MNVRVVRTADGSDTVVLGDSRIAYHSLHGALTESRQVFIQYGLKRARPDKTHLKIVEVGFGTGLNALLTLLHSGRQHVDYLAIEPHPLDEPIWSNLNYPEILTSETAHFFEALHEAPFEATPITSDFILTKKRMTLADVHFAQNHHLVYFDPFDPAHQPELWTPEVFQRIFKAVLPGGILVTYSAKGSVRRSMQQAGFYVERLAGPPGKTHVTRAMKPTATGY